MEYSAYSVLPGETLESRVLIFCGKLENNQPNVEHLCKENLGYVVPEILLNASKCRKV